MEKYTLVNISNPVDFKLDFFKLNPLLLLIDEFEDIKKYYKGKRASNLMWAIWCYCDTNNANKFRELSDEILKKSLKKVSKDFSLGVKRVKAVVDIYDDLCLTHAQREYKKQVESLKNRTTIIIKSERALMEAILEDPLSVGEHEKSLKIIQDMRKSSKDMYERYDEIAKLFEKETTEIEIYGGGTENIKEKGLLQDVEGDL